MIAWHVRIIDIFFTHNKLASIRSRVVLPVVNNYRSRKILSADQHREIFLCRLMWLRDNASESFKNGGHRRLFSRVT